MICACGSPTELQWVCENCGKHVASTDEQRLFAWEVLTREQWLGQSKMPRPYRAANEIGKEASKIAIQIVGRTYPSATEPEPLPVKDRLVRIRRLCDLIEEDLADVE